MKVEKDFFCTQEQKAYSKGEQYTGTRKDIDHLLEKKKPKAQPKKEVRTVEKKEAAPVAKKTQKATKKATKK